MTFLVEGGGSYFRGQALMVDNRLYLIAMEGLKGKMDEKVYTKFLKSFRLNQGYSALDVGVQGVMVSLVFDVETAAKLGSESKIPNLGWRRRSRCFGRGCIGSDGQFGL